MLGGIERVKVAAAVNESSPVKSVCFCVGVLSTSDCGVVDWVKQQEKAKMPLFGKKDSGKKVRKDGHKDIDKQIINIEDKYHLRQVLGK